MRKTKGRKVVPLTTKCVRMIGSVNFIDEYHCNLSQKLLEAEISTLFETNPHILEYYFIVHTDTDKLHFHFALVNKESIELMQMLRYISDNLHIDINGVSISKMDSLCGALKYFLHIDAESVELGKQKYESTSMVYNVSDFIYNNYLSSVHDNDIDMVALTYLVLGCSCESIVYLHIGDRNFCNRNRGLIHQIFEDKAEIRRYLKETELPF